MAAFHHVLVPIATQFAPTLIIVSAGFDAAEGATNFPDKPCADSCQHWSGVVVGSQPVQLSYGPTGADAGDPIGGCNVTSAGFAAMTGLLQAVAPIALVLEVSTEPLTGQLRLLEPCPLT
jgi:Histone deacetylase domain